jgi:hypothetical protein
VSEITIAPGVGVLAVRTNRHGRGFGPGVDAGLVYKITVEALKQSNLPEAEFEIEQTPVSAVISPKYVNLENAARIAVASLDPEALIDMVRIRSFHGRGDGVRSQNRVRMREQQSVKRCLEFLEQIVSKAKQGTAMTWPLPERSGFR